MFPLPQRKALWVYSSPFPTPEPGNPAELAGHLVASGISASSCLWGPGSALIYPLHLSGQYDAYIQKMPNKRPLIIIGCYLRASVKQDRIGLESRWMPCLGWLCDLLCLSFPTCDTDQGICGDSRVCLWHIASGSAWATMGPKAGQRPTQPTVFSAPS